MRLVRTSTTLIAALSLAAGLAACAGDEDGGIAPDAPAPSADVIDPGTPDERIAKRLSVLALSVAVAQEGRSVFDNYLPCVRRGVIEYVNTEAGRAVTFNGCDVGGRVTVDGQGELEWVGPELSASREDITRLRFTGSLAVHIDDQPAQTVDSLDLDAVEFAYDGSQTFPARLQLTSMNVTMGDVQITVDQPDIVTSMFDSSGMTIDSIPHSGSVAELADVDIKRFAFHAGMYHVRVLFNEALESQRGDHSHDLPCGRSDVVYDQVNQAVHMTNAWTSCEDMGLFMTGDFSAVMYMNAPNQDRLDIEIDGALTIGGGVPTVTLEAMQMSLTFPSSGQPEPWNLSVSGSIHTDVDSTAFDFAVVVDD